GLLLGESRSEEQITISDSQADHIHIEETYNIQKHIACHRLSDFYNSVGDVDVDAVKEILADNKQCVFRRCLQDSVIGWYRQRRNSDQQMTFREKLIHDRLKASLSNPHMIFVLLTPSKSSAAGSTHRTEYAAFISRSRRFLKVPVLVNNLGLLEQLSYWKVSAGCSAAGYSATMRKHGSRFFSSNGLLREVNDMNKMNESLQAELQKACGDVEESERLVETLQAELSVLRRRISEKQRNNGKEPDEDPADQKNLLLHEAVRVLLSPLLHSQTLTLDGFLVPDVCCRGAERDVSTTTLSGSPLRPGRTNARRRSKREAAGEGEE
ncbi:hypothetical protein L3Q82_012802, partial [Scortum barcoo]